ncbi:hypothetical protein [Leptospira noguchii]|uniref:hypothetical protein n=1 Tax=Leptospira noguchii TaxID=28182 RepID=UPI001FB6AB26|nr:hypothetical protein [Leptospira noguchii]UOG31185.1 hypothetical protein MAL06_03785 [Leptospira noguchii]UOG53338.1 hypothetical protein MAL09_03915 [Leptospira noguchii]
MFPVCNLLTRAESPAGCLWQAGFARFSYVELTLFLGNFFCSNNQEKKFKCPRSYSLFQNSPP